MSSSESHSSISGTATPSAVSYPNLLTSAEQNLLTPAEQNLAKRMLSELLHTGEETVEKPILTFDDICERVSVLTEMGMRLDDLIEPGTECYELLNDTVPETETPDEPMPMRATASASDQVVPIVSTSSTLKRRKSFDDSGLRNTPPKQLRKNPPSPLLARRQHGRVRRTLSAPSL